MDNEMIERVAKAIFTKRYQAPGTYQDLKWEDYKGKEFYLEDARQAFKAMREPTEKMLKAEGVHPSCHMCGGHKEGWQTMIDAVIND